ncbi:hypothetical protein [Pseudoalteromonas sp. McH1-42]|uniref:hypothetical protein n=1 Tax=Pseudoalteromonas sp. McH1-42 TaxID=2917752 RepID=UPI001EF40E7A|nr:hypothetical protein [Pseudoalteromonas sp. McH1-42]MCG7561683.1 hypothetical protein [Pseudoalteromonas sp. McH1-42]
MKNYTPIQPDWLSKTLAGIIGGGLLSFSIVGLFAWFGPSGLASSISDTELLWRTQFNMWLSVPIWLLALSFTYMFRSGARAWFCLLSVSAACFAVLAILRGVS